MKSAIHESPLGSLTLVSNGEALTQLTFEQHSHCFATAPAGDDAILRQARRELALYFAGKLRSFSVPLAPIGTAFQRRAWTALCDIPFGATRTYAQQAAAMGAPAAVRAVGAANGRNPISIIVPCHRVIASGGALAGYAGGLGRKQHLLDLERGARPSR